MKYVIANCGYDKTNMFEYETDNSEELFKFIKMNNNAGFVEIEVYKHHKIIDDEAILKLANIIGRIPTLLDLWDHQMYGEPILDKYNDRTDKINVLSEEN